MHVYMNVIFMCIYINVIIFMCVYKCQLIHNGEETNNGIETNSLYIFKYSNLNLIFFHM